MTNQDRTYLSMLSDRELVNATLEHTHELSVVLAERLSVLLDVEDQLEDAKKLIHELTESRDNWRLGAIHAEDELVALRCAE
jgi:hypothetical protein